jgi:gluconate 2-dehydrogenase alpha chain
MGAAGARAAAVLAGAGLRVVGVEAGGWEPSEPGWFARTVPWVRRAPGDAATPTLEPAPLANAVGGSNHRSARQSYRLDLDATPARWPLTTDELLPYFSRVEGAVAVEPSPAAPWTEMMRAAAARLEWETITAPIATAAPLGAEELGPLIESGALELLTETIALELITAGDGSVVGAEVMGRGGRERIEAKRVVLAAQTFENVRLLLLSRPPSHPEGVGNSRGQVGAGFATHNLLLAHGHFPGTDLARHLGAPGDAVAVIDFDHEDPRGAHPAPSDPSATGLDPMAALGAGTGFGAAGDPAIAGGGADHDFRGGSILQAAMGAADPKRVTAATGLRGEAIHEVGTVWAQPEQLAREENRLDLDPSRLDPLGRPLLVATHDLDAEDRARADFLLARMAEWLTAAGADMTWRAKPRPTSIATHSYGGTVMGLDPEASVVDRLCQVHDAPGLFVLGASTFPATGGRGPTETIEAFAWRTADRIVAELGD